MQNQLKEKPWTSVSTSITGLSQKYHVITCPVKMKENEMGNQRELKGSTIMHKFIHCIDAAPFQARPALKY